MSTFPLVAFLLPLLLLLLSSLFHTSRKNATFHATLRHGNHSQIFAYLSDVAAFRALNPTIIDIIRWERTNETSFYVEYSEYLSQVPAVTNHGRAYYEIQNGRDGSHSLVSRHSTCFLSAFLCLPTDSRLDVTQKSPSEVGYREYISYSCPWILSTFCFHEVAAQRKLIVAHLKEKFSRTDTQTAQPKTPD